MEQIPFARLAGVEIVSAEKDLVVGRMDWSAERCTSFGVLHGGALMTLGDTLGAVCASLNMPEGSMTTTIESKTNFFRPLTQGHVEGRTRPLHVGRTTICVQTDVRNPEGKLVAQITQTQAVRSA